MRRHTIFAATAALIGASVAVLLAASGAAASAAGVPRSLGSVPLGFEVNRGQAPGDVRFMARGAGYGIFVRSRDLVLAVGRPSEASVVRMVPVEPSKRMRLRPSRLLPRHTNYLVGRAPAGRHTRVPSYGRVTYEEVHPGVDLVLRGDQSAVRYDYVLAAGADPGAIRMRFEGAEALSIDRDGDLVVETRVGELRHRAPVVFQRAGAGRRRLVPGRFHLRGPREVGFRIGDHDAGRPLVIDPVVEYSGFLGGATSYDSGQALAVGADGSAFVGGVTFAADYPTTPAAFDPFGHGPSACAPGQDPGFLPPPEESCHSDAFVSKLTPGGDDLVFSTFLGGSRRDRVHGIDVDADGAVYLAGGTESADFPTTAQAPDIEAGGRRRVMGAGLVVLGEAFLAKLAADGSHLVYSTLLGGADADEAMGVAVGRHGDAYVTGHTFSSDFPTTRGAFDRELNVPGVPSDSCSDVFVAKLGPAGDELGYSTLLGGRRLEFSWDLDVDRRGAAYVMGESMSADAPVTPGAFQPSGHFGPGAADAADCRAPLDLYPDADALVVKLAADGSRLSYSTFLGGSGHEHGLGIAVHRGAAHVAGHTDSADFPTTPQAAQRSVSQDGPLNDGFVAKLAPDGGALDHSTLLGGTGDDWVFDVDVDAGGTAYLTGLTTSRDFPTTPDAFDSSFGEPVESFSDAFLGRLSADGSRLLHSSYLGGSGPDVGTEVVAGAPGSAHLTGLTFSPDLPATPSAFQSSFAGPPAYSDAFVAKVSGFPAQRPPARPALRLRVRPRAARAGRRTLFRVGVTTRSPAGERPVRGAAVRLGRRSVVTDEAGRAAVRAVMFRPGRQRLRARSFGFEPGRAAIRVRRR